MWHKSCRILDFTLTLVHIWQYDSPLYHHQAVAGSTSHIYVRLFRFVYFDFGVNPRSRVEWLLRGLGWLLQGWANIINPFTREWCTSATTSHTDGLQHTAAIFPHLSCPRVTFFGHIHRQTSKVTSQLTDVPGVTLDRT